MTTKYHPTFAAHTIWTRRANVVDPQDTRIKFTDLTPMVGEWYGEGVRIVVHLPNGKFVSVVRNPRSYGWLDGLYEAVVAVPYDHTSRSWTYDGYELDHDTLRGHLSEDEVEQFIEEARAR